ncbi:MAG: Ycf66 family protein [Cyanobacteria bacterium J06607_17]
MLANVLAVIVGIGSLAFYLVAFILPEVHRRSDFFWSGVGMFYAVVLWYCARQINGAVLLGQTASVGLLLWLGYQTLRLRRETTPSAQQTPIRLGKSERSRTASRPIAKDYEFVEDGVEDTLDQEPDPDSPILIQPAVDEFAPKMIVPAAMPTSAPEADGPETDVPEESPTKDSPTPVKPARKQKNPLAAIGIVAGWLKDVVTPKKKEPKPMIELPPRPPSIPKLETETSSDSANAADSSANTSDTEKPEVTIENVNISPTLSAQDTPSAQGALSAQDTLTNLKPAIVAAADEAVPTASSAAPQQDDDEDSNWPEDEFWD